MVLKLILFALLVVLGCFVMVLGMKGIRNRRILNGFISLVVGLACVGFSGFRIYEELHNAFTDERIVEARGLLKEVHERQRKTMESRGHFVKQIEQEYDKLSALGIPAEAIVDRVHTDPSVKALVERITLLNRWIGLCDEQLLWDATAVQSYENILFYYDNLRLVGSLQLDNSQAFAAGIDLEKVIEEAKTQSEDSNPLEVTAEELQVVVDRLRSR
jgi:hypothetical protein